MTNFLIVSPTLPIPRSCSTSILPKFSFNCPVQRKWLGRVHCLDKKPESEAEATMVPSTSSDSGISTYSWCAVLGGLGFLETSYLTYLKLTDSEVFCPVGGGGCGNVLNSNYASVLGVPLPLIGVFAYGLVTILGLQLSANKYIFDIDKNIGRLILLGTTTSMTIASAYFLYILSTKFEGVTCFYCLASALLSFTLLLMTIKDFDWQEIQKKVVLQLCLGGLVIALLNTSYGSSQSGALSSGDVELRPYTTEITTESSSLALALAKHLHSIGAKMYGAFWCSHCLEQKEVLSGELELTELANASGFKL